MKFIPKIIAGLLLLPLSANAAITLIDHNYSSNGVATPTLNCTGANFIWVKTNYFNTPSAPTDSSSNTYTLINAPVYGGFTSTADYVVFNPTVTSSMTFSLGTGGVIEPSCWSGVASVGPLSSVPNTTVAGPITPPNPNMLITASIGGQGATEFTGNTSNGGPIITSVSSTSGMAVGSLVVGPGIPVGATIITLSSTITLSVNATATASTQPLRAISIAIASPFTLLDPVLTEDGGTAYGGTAYQIQASATSVSSSWTTNPTGIPAAVTMMALYSTSNPAPLVVTTTSLAECFVGHACSDPITASGGVQPYTCAVTTGSLPSPLTLTNCVITGTPTSASTTNLVITVTDAQSTSQPSGTLTLTIAAATLSLSGSCPTGTQYVTYAGCTMSGTGGTSPLTYTWSGYVPWTGQSPHPNNGVYNAFPEGLTIDTATGIISGTPTGMGGYFTQMLVTDSLGAQASLILSFSIQGGNGNYGGCTFPADSIFRQRVDSLPVDTNPEDQLWTPELGPLQLGFNSTNQGIPVMTVPSSQTLVSVLAGVTTSFSMGPIPWKAPMEATRNGPGSCTLAAPCPPIDDYRDDNHVLILQTAGGGNSCHEWDLYDIYPNYAQPGTSYDVVSAGATWGGGWFPDTVGGYSNGDWDMGTTGPNAYKLLAQGQTAGDEGGLPMINYLPTVDEVIGTGSPSAPNGAVLHAIRFTENHTGNGHVWPTTHAAGLNSNCTGGTFVDPTGNNLITQITIPGSGPGTGTPNTACTGVTGPVGEIYRLKASATPPACLSTSPQANIIYTALKQYGAILADNGRDGTLTGVMDPRWNDADLACLTNVTTADMEPVLTQQLAVNFMTSSQVITSGGPGGTTTTGTTSMGTTISTVAPPVPPTVNMTVTVTDSTGKTTSQPFTIAVNPPPPPPLVITTLFLPSFTKAQPYLQPIAATGGVPPYTFSLSGAPAGVAINSSTGMISGTP